MLILAVDWQRVRFGAGPLVIAAVVWSLRKFYVHKLWAGTRKEMESKERLLGFVAACGVIIGIAMVVSGLAR
jgi:hypothetical protein